MQYLEVKPPESLSHLVRYFWVIAHDGSIHESTQFKLFAESCPGLVFFCRSGYSILSGPTTDHKTFSISGSFKMIGAYLYPYALSMLFDIPAGDFAGKQIKVSELSEAESRVLSDQVMNAEDDTERIEYISSYLAMKAKMATGFDKAIHAGVHQLMSAHGNLSIDSLANDINLSQRQMERKFMSSVGISPKLLARLIRFQHSLRIPLHKKINSLTDLALQAGYYDQSHFIREFSAFSGVSPKDYFNLEKAHVADNFIQF